MKLHVRGPYIQPERLHLNHGALWLCYDPDQPHLSVAGISPMIAYRVWQSIYGARPA